MSMDVSRLSDNDLDVLSQLFQQINSEEYEALDELFAKDNLFFNRFLFAEYIGDGTFDLEETMLNFYEQKLGLSAPVSIDEWFDCSLDELFEHQSKHGRDDHKSITLTSLYSNSKCTEIDIQIIVHDERPAIGSILWDKLRAESINPRFLGMHICELGFIVVNESKQIKSWTPAPLFMYHPERYKQTRNYVSHLDKTGFNSRNISEESLNEIMSVMVREVNEKGSKEPLREKIQAEEQRAFSIPNKELEAYILYSNFVRSGRQIFDVSGKLVDMFRHTSIDDIPVESLASPYQTFYVYFGPQDDLSFTTDWHVDGAYIQHVPEANLIQFLFTSAPKKPESCRNWTSSKEPLFAIGLVDKHFKMGLGDAVRDALDGRKSELKDKIAKGDRDLSSELNSVADQEGLDLDGIRLIEKAETVGKEQLASLEREIPVLKGALELAVNAMCYLTAYPDDISKEWPSKAPKSMVEKAMKGHPTVKRNTSSKLESLGYHRVHIAGRALSQGPATTEHKSGSVRAHWRRGHWKRQPYGPERSLRKMVLIKPVLVNPGDGYRDEALGTIYIGENVIDLKKKRRNALR